MRNRFNIIIITGLIGSGKTTLTNELVKKYSTIGEVNVLKFADNARKLLEVIFNIDLSNEIDYELWKTNNRQYLINLGQGAKKLFGEYFWVDLLCKEIDTIYCKYASNSLREVCEPGTHTIIIPDLRFQEEVIGLFNYLKELSIGNDLFTTNDVKIMFTDYHSERYSSENDSKASEALPLFLRGKGLKHLDILSFSKFLDITEEFIIP